MVPPPQQPCCRVSLTEICSLYQRLFQTPTDLGSVQAAVDQVCGVSRHGGFCCSSRLLDVLVEVERRRWMKEQIYWDFQLLDFNRDSSLSLSDAKVLLQKAEESQITSLSWVDFLTQREETSGRVTWSELEAWLFGNRSFTKPGSRESAGERQLKLDPEKYQEDFRAETQRLKGQWDSEGLVGLVRATEETGNERRHLGLTQEDLKEAVELKYAALNEKLFCDMLQAHYGAQTWTSLDAEQKEKNLMDFKMLAQFGLERGSELVLSQLPGATHNFRDETGNVTSEEKWIAIQGLKELQRRLELELQEVSSTNKGKGNPVATAYQYYLLFAQTNKVKMESSFRAAVLVVEPQWCHRFWDESPVCLETCFEELAHIRLTTGQRLKSKLDKPNLQKMPMEEDKLLSLLKRQEEVRDLLFQLLQSCSHEELQEPLSNLLHNTAEEHNHPIKDGKATRSPVRDLFRLAMMVTKTCLQEERGVVTWGECAVRLLVQVQLKQELELKELLHNLANRLTGDAHDGHQATTVMMEGRDPVSDLIQQLQPLTPQEQLTLSQLNMEFASGEGDACIEKELSINEQNVSNTCKITENKVNNKMQTENRQLFVDPTNEEIPERIDSKTGRNQNESQDIIKNNNNQLKIPEASQKELPKSSQKSCSCLEKSQGLIYRATNVPLQREHRNGHTESFECISDRRLPTDHGFGGKPLSSEECTTSFQSKGKDPNQMKPSSPNEECEMNRKNSHVQEQVSKNEMASSVLEATESLVAGLMTLKEKMEQVYIMRDTAGQKEADRRSLQSLENNLDKAHSHEHLESSVMEAAESLIKKLTTLKEEINRVSQSQVTIKKEAPPGQYKSEDTNDEQDATGIMNITKPPATLEDVKRNNISLDEEDVQTCKENGCVDSPHVPEEMIREVSWELHPECSHNCSHAKLWDAEFNSDHTSGKNLEERKIPEERAGKSISHLKGCGEKELPVGSQKHHVKYSGNDKQEITPQIRDQNAGRQDQDIKERQDQHFSAMHTENKDMSGFSRTTQKEYEEDAHASSLLMDDSSKNDHSEDSADKLALSFLEAAQNLVGGLIPGKEEAVGQVVVILRDGSSRDGEESDMSGTISIMEGSSGEESQDPNLSKEDEGADNPSGKESSWKLQDDCIFGSNHDNSQEECSGEHCTKTTDLSTQQPFSADFEGTEMTCCHSDGCERKLETSLLESQYLESNEILLAAQKAVTSEGCGEADVGSDPVKQQQDTVNGQDNKKEDGAKDYAATRETKDNVECFDHFGCERSGETVSQREIEDETCDLFLDQRTVREPTYTLASDIEKSLSQTGGDITENIMIETTECRGTLSHNDNELEGSRGGKGQSNRKGNLESQDNDSLGPTDEDKSKGIKTNEIVVGKMEEHNDLNPYRGSPDTLVQNVLLATQDLIGSLTSLKDSIGNNNVATIERNSRNETINVQRSSENPTCVNLEELALQHITENQPTYTSQTGGDITENIMIETTECRGTLSLNDNELEGSREGKSQSNLKENLESQDDDSPRRWPTDEDKSKEMKTNEIVVGKMKEHNDLEGSSFSSLVATEEVSMSPARQLLQRIECMSEQQIIYSKMRSEEILSDSQGCLNLKTKWRSLCVKQILKSHISERIKVQVMEESGSSLDLYSKVQDLAPTITTNIVGFELINDSIKTDDCALGTAEEPYEAYPVMSIKNTESGMDNTSEESEDIKEPDSLEDLTASLMEETSSLIGKLTSLKGELRKSQTDLDNKNIENASASTEQINQSKLTQSKVSEEKSIVCKIKGSETGACVIKVQQKRDDTGNGNSEICQVMCEENNSEPKLEVQSVDECQKDVQIQGHPKESNNDNKAKCPTSANPLTNLNQGEHHSQCDHHQANTGHNEEMETKAEAQALLEQDNSLSQIKETGISNQIIFSTHIIENCKYEGYPKQYEYEEQMTVPETHEETYLKETSSEMAFSELNWSETCKKTSAIEDNGGVHPSHLHDNQIDNDKMANEIEHGVKQNNKDYAQNTEVKDLTDTHNLRRYIKNEVMRRTLECTEDMKEEKNQCSYAQVMAKENPEKPSVCGIMIKCDGGKGVQLDNVDTSSKTQTANNDSLLAHAELPTNSESIMKHQRQEESMQIESFMKMHVINSQMVENKGQTKEMDNQTVTEQPMQQLDIETYGEHSHLTVSKQAAGARSKSKDEKSETLALAIHGDNIWNDMSHVPANGVLKRNEAQLSCLPHPSQQPHAMPSLDGLQVIVHTEHKNKLQPCTEDSIGPRVCSLPLGKVALQREKVFIRLSLREQQEALQRLRDLHKEAELKCTSDRRRQMLRFQEKLSIARNRKSEMDLMGITQRRSPQMTPELRPEADKERQKSAVRERVEQMKRERTYIMQTKRDRNMSTFRELLDPVLAKNKREESGTELRGADGM